MKYKVTLKGKTYETTFVFTKEGAKDQNVTFTVYDGAATMIGSKTKWVNSDVCVATFYFTANESIKKGTCLELGQLCDGSDVKLTFTYVDFQEMDQEKLEKLLDFVAVTHNHLDHYSMPLMRKINAAKKLVISNFFPNSGYTKHHEYTHKLPGVTIHCYEADHNKRLRKFTMPMEFVCKTGDKNFVFYTSGDCWSHEFLSKKSDRIDLYVLHPRCGMKPVNAAKKLDPELTFIGHLQEMGHEINRFRWQFSVGRVELENLKQINKKAYVPVWAEKFIWDGEKITGCQK